LGSRIAAFRRALPGDAPVYTVIAMRKRFRSQGQAFSEIEGAKAEAQHCSRHLADQALVYGPYEKEPRCVFEHGKLVVCRCPEPTA
jgi:hypothetical protein